MSPSVVFARSPSRQRIWCI